MFFKYDLYYDITEFQWLNSRGYQKWHLIRKKFSKDTFNSITTRADIAIITNDVKMTILFFFIKLSIGA